ncbi:MAG: hypothetical protein E3J21_14000 [Anaerolineales bacterium]|nr:MAG: hypothetical protein E3J21_14000 [Anaerolineales bacterium]
MLKRLIENWLTSLSERDLDIPFRLLLEAEGHVAVGHRTVHGLAELGKDIVSWHPTQGLVYFFQLKTGDAKPSDWNEMERQIRQMVEVPYVHPNYTVEAPYQPVWVCTGQLSESVRLSLGLKNKEHQRIGKPPIQVWERNCLIEKYHSAFFDVLFADEYFVVDFLRLWSHASNYMSDEDSLREFLHHYLFELPAAKEREMRKHLATYALILAQLSQRYVSMSDLYSGIDCALLGAVQLYEFIVSQAIEPSRYQDCLRIVHEFVGFLLRNLVDQCTACNEIVKDLLEVESGPSEIFELPLRAHSLASKIALSLLLKSLRGQDAAMEIELLQDVLENNPAFCHIISERQMGTFWVSTLGLLRANRLELAKRCVVETFDWFMKFHGKEGQLGIPDPYQPYRVAINHHLRIETHDVRLLNMNGQSYLLPILLKFICHLGLRDALAQHWKPVSFMTVREYRPSSAEELFAYRPQGGRMTLCGFPVTGSWSGIQEQYSERLTSEIVEFTERYPESLLFLALAYPWRAQWREVERYI